MAENKKSFLLYCDLIHTVTKMPIDKAGELFIHILKYVNDENPVTEDLITNLTFEPIKQSLKRDLEKWENTLEGRSRAGKASAEIKRQSKQNVTKSTSVEFVERPEGRVWPNLFIHLSRHAGGLSHEQQCYGYAER